MNLFDTHVHFPGEGETPDAAEWVERGHAAGVACFTAVGGSKHLNAGVEAVAARFPAEVLPAIGFDRDQAGMNHALLLEWLSEKLEGTAGKSDVICPVAVGEIGMDLHYQPENAAMQRALFEAQLAFAREHGLPVIVHCRDAEEAVLECLQKHAALADTKRCPVPGVLHCFTGTRPFARKLLDAGYTLSFSGIVTFKNAVSLRETAKWAPLEQIVIETDSPFLAPVPHRGKKNEPALIRYVAETLAEVRGCPVKELAAAVWRNSCRLFSV